MGNAREFAKSHNATEGKILARLLLTDDEWNLIADVFPEPAVTGRPPSDRRVFVNGILWILRTGSPWRDLPEEFGPCKTVWRLFELRDVPAALSRDKGYRADWIDEYLLDLGISPVIPSKANEDRDARPVEFDRDAYRERNIVERLIGWLKESR